LQSEGSFLELDKNDDANSKFTDTYISYYKDGNVEEKKTFVDGKLNGEYSIYFNNGNINKHFLMSEGNFASLVLSTGFLVLLTTVRLAGRLRTLRLLCAITWDVHITARTIKIRFLNLISLPIFIQLIYS
jgi:hypothetical protein